MSFETILAAGVSGEAWRSVGTATHITPDQSAGRDGYDQTECEGGLGFRRPARSAALNAPMQRIGGLVGLR